MYTPNDDPFRWLSTPRWYLWEGGFLVTARAQGVVPAHAHHAIQVVIALDGTIASRASTAEPAGDAGWQESRGIIVRPDAEHSFDCNGAFGVMLFVDPESREGTWLARSLRQDITQVADTKLAALVGELGVLARQPEEVAEIGGLVQRTVDELRPGLGPARRLDARVTRVLDTIATSDNLRISLDGAADVACLSPTRFAHLFKEQVGLPFSRYMLWRKLTRAMVAIASEGTIGAAAHAADFADAAHLTRTFYQMFGIAPSALMQGDLIEITPPFHRSGDQPEAGSTRPGAMK